MSGALVLASSRVYGEQSRAHIRWRRGGLASGDCCYVLSHHTQAGTGARGAVLRRLYPILDADFDNGWFGLMPLGTNESGQSEACNFEAGR